MARAKAAREPAAGKSMGKHPAFQARALTGYDVATWQMKEHLTNWDAAFALGFTSYQALLTFLKDYQQGPVDESRDMLVRLYLLEPSFPTHFRPPDMQSLVDFLFGLTVFEPEYAAERRKKCASLLAKLLGKNRGSGYRWLRAAENSEQAVATPVRRLSSKVFSMDPATSRATFWKAANAMAIGRGFDMSEILQFLKEHGVAVD
ncbi:hypothetical protein [Massilia varians]|uniref:hypothetical protein n=1 Tax=Massilia varians TaxID=457921 RepID=UPI002555D504|nr:hypothetical protein [Massilia varians]MDK6076166.1 hypothetical protein [Massilia varians]